MGNNAQCLSIFVSAFNEYQHAYIKIHPDLVGCPAEGLLNDISRLYWVHYSQHGNKYPSHKS